MLPLNKQVVDHALAVTVGIIARSAQKAAQLAPQKAEDAILTDLESNGSGFVFSADGLIITNNHVAIHGEDGKMNVVFADGRTLPAELVGTSPQADVAVIKITPFPGMQVATIGDAKAISHLDPVFAIGAPQGLEFTTTFGTISHPRRFSRGWKSRYGKASVLPAIQTHTAVNPGNSGGPLFNAAGEVIGMNTFILTAPVTTPKNQYVGNAMGHIGLNFAITAVDVARVARAIIRKAHTNANRTGIKVQSPNAVDRRLMRDPKPAVTHVEPNSNAQIANVQARDVITHVNDIPVSSAQEAEYQIFMHEIEGANPITLTLDRDGKSVKVNIVMGTGMTPAPSTPGKVQEEKQAAATKGARAAGNSGGNNKKR